MTRPAFCRPAALALAAGGLFFSVVGPVEAADAASRGVSLKVITFGEERAQLQSTPIEQRPYRPLHFYGNRVRRQSRRSSTPTNSRTRATPTSNRSQSSSRRSS